MRQRDSHLSLVTIFALLLLVGVTCKQTSHQNRLIRNLFEDYKKDAHPGDGARVNVTFGAKLTRIADVEEKHNSLQAQWWVKQRWNNPDIQWNKSDYGGLERIHVEPSKVWVPDILLYNNADNEVDASGGLQKFKTKVELSYNGYNTWLAPAMFRSMCTIDITYFPFDEQLCSLRFGSWAYDITKLDVFPDYNQTELYQSMFTENQEWEYVSLTIDRTEEKFPCCANPYSTLVITVHVRRRSMYYLVYLVFPCALIACMVFLTFVIPPESGERISLSITVLMAMAIFQELTSQKLPPSGDGFFLLGVYYSLSICEIGTAIACTCVVLNLYYRRTEMPKWARKLLLGRLAKLAFVKVATPHPARKARHKSTNFFDFERSLPSNNKDGNVEISEPTIGKRDNPVALQSIHYNTEDNHDVQMKGSVRSRSIKEAAVSNGMSLNGSLRIGEPQSPFPLNTTSPYHEDELYQRLTWQEEWKTAALVLDRIILICAVLIGAVSMAAVFFQAPRVRKYFNFE